MEKAFDPKQVEQDLYQQWEKADYFHATTGADKSSYCIVLPPPNVTGSLHMGHAFQQTLMDVLTRYHRMCGNNTLWQAGTDHAGIATQMVVEKQLEMHGKTRHDLGREAFVDRIWQWKEESGNRISQQMRRLGASMDWSRERFTLDPELSKVVSDVFIQLYREGLIYRGQRLVNWDPVLHTAISDLEVMNEEKPGKLWHIRYPLSDNSAYIVVATTRPETMLGDTAVAVHPDDTRYQSWIGKKIKLPLTGREIPIIADTYVDPEFGSGCVKITPAHDFNDYEIGKRHNLPLINIFTIDAQINDNAPEKYQGLDRFTARVQVLEDLEAQNLIEKIEDHTLKVPMGDRSGAIIEPYLTHQWYVNVKPLAEPAIDAVKSGKIQFIPENWSKTYFSWMENIEDWCISRQIWWGHRIPAWYDDNGNVYVGHSEEEVRKHYQLNPGIALKQDPDVLDTWFSSALWPFSTLGWPEQTPEFKTFYPTSVLITGFDIIFFWVARMIMMGLKFTGEIPFKQVYITGLIRDAEGQKMSKSKGNILDPLDLIDGISVEELVAKRTSGLMQPKMAEQIKKNTLKEFPNGIPAFGTDPLRFNFCAIATSNRDIRFDLQRIEGYRHFCNKLWNATRYVLMNTEDYAPIAAPDPKDRHLIDRWILSKLQTLIHEVHRTFNNYRFDLAAQALYDFTWNEYCDWYLELSKPILTDSDRYSTAQQQATRHTLLVVLETLQRLLHPIMPFITETLWQNTIQKLAGHTDKTSIMVQAFPASTESLIEKNAEEALEWIKAVVLGIRRIRGEMNISPQKALPILFKNAQAHDRRICEHHELLLKSLAKISEIQWLGDNDSIPPAATALAGHLEILIPLAGIIDKSEELARLNKDIQKIEKELTKAKQQLDNPNYRAKAPADVIEKLETQAENHHQALLQLQQRYREIESL